jgi:hypothetical protein
MSRRLLPSPSRAAAAAATLLTPIARRTTAATALSVSHARLSSSFQSQPSPPRLPAEQQAEFERLQREAEARLHTHTQPVQQTSPLATSRHVSTPDSSSSSATESSPPDSSDETATATLSGGIRKGAAPEFSGDKNPKTGEVGGPKNEPLRWGSEGDWSYNGRVTDF